MPPKGRPYWCACYLRKLFEHVCGELGSYCRAAVENVFVNGVALVVVGFFRAGDIFAASSEKGVDGGGFFHQIGEIFRAGELFHRAEEIFAVEFFRRIAGNINNGRIAVDNRTGEIAVFQLCLAAVAAADI